MANLKLALVMSLLNFVVMILLGMFLIKTFYKIEWGKAALTWLVWFVFSLVAGLIVGLIVAAIYIGAAVSAVL